MNIFRKTSDYLVGKAMKWPIPYKLNRSLDDINIRDPFIVIDDNRYILTGTIYRFSPNDSYGVVIYKSYDKTHWEGPFNLLSKNEIHDSFYDFSSPEIHKVNNKFFLLVTLTPKIGIKGVYLFISDNIDGPYVYQCRVTPINQYSYSGTLLLQRNDIFIAYCHKSENSCAISYVKLNKNITGIIDESERLVFDATSNKYFKTTKNYTIDNPQFFYDNNILYLLWSTNINNGNLAQMISYSATSKIQGPWFQQFPLIIKDGGNGMAFIDRDHQPYLIYHHPNKKNFFANKIEHPHIEPIV